MPKLKTAAELAAPPEPTPKPSTEQARTDDPLPGGLLAAQLSLAQSEKTAREAQEQISAIQAKREHLFRLQARIDSAEKNLRDARLVHSRHVASQAALEGGLTAAFAKNDPHGHLTRNYYAAQSSIERALADWPRVEAHYQAAVDALHQHRRELEGEVGSLIEGTSETLVAIPEGSGGIGLVEADFRDWQKYRQGPTEEPAS